MYYLHIKFEPNPRTFPKWWKPWIIALQ